MAVPEQHLNDAQVGALFEQVRRKALHRLPDYAACSSTMLNLRAFCFVIAA